jgi:undecaprenyl-diphosphatase
MSQLFYLIYGAVQGLTEFLPISSSGHLVIAQTILGQNLQGIALEITLHLATLLAVIVFLRKRIWQIFGGIFSRGEKSRIAWRALLAVIVATIPAGLVGIFFGNFLESTFENIQVVGICLLLTSAMVISIPFLPKKNYTIEKFPWLGIIVVGIFQAVAILPGVSRAGATIFAGTLMGLNRKESASFSFIISIPAILGASVLELPKVISGRESAPALGLALSAVCAIIFGLLALFLLYKTVQKGSFLSFGIYTLILSILILTGFILWLNGILHSLYPEIFLLSG